MKHLLTILFTIALVPIGVLLMTIIWYFIVVFAVPLAVAFMAMVIYGATKKDEILHL